MQNIQRKGRKDVTRTKSSPWGFALFGHAVHANNLRRSGDLLMHFVKRHMYKYIMTSPITCKPRYWKRYVDDILEIIKQGSTHDLNDNLNTIDPTSNIKFTYEEEQQGKMSFLDALIARKSDNTVKMLVYT